MDRNKAIKILAAADEDTDFDGSEAELFAAIYGRKPDADDQSTGLISLCYADPDVAAAVTAAGES